MHNRVEREYALAYLSYPNDGLTDIFAGLTLIVAALAIASSGTWLLGLAIIPLWLAWMGSKRMFTAPRLREDELIAYLWNRRAIQVVSLLGGLAALLAVAGAAILLVTNTGSMPGLVDTVLDDYTLTGIGLLAAAMFAILARVSHIDRLLAYAVLSLGIFFGSYMLHVGFATSLGLLGAAITLIGALIMRHFLRDHPL